MDPYYLTSKPNNGSTFLFFLVLSFFLLMATPAVAQRASDSPGNNSTTTTSSSRTFALIFVALILLFFIAAISIIIFSCGGPNSARAVNPTVPTDENGAIPVMWVIPVVRQSGIDKSVLDTFPIIKFAEVKGLNPGKLECAVCLSEYDDSDTLRILPGCCHVFHPDCIDSWLSNHDACPVCRANPTNLNIISTEPQPEAGNDGESTGDGGNRMSMSMSMERKDRFTLRLSEHALRQIEVQRGYKLSASVAGSGYQGTPMSKSGRVWNFIRTFSSRRGLEVGGVNRSGRHGGSFRRNPTMGRTGSIHEMLPVRSSSVRPETGLVLSGMAVMRSSSVRVQPNGVMSDTELVQSGSVTGQAGMAESSTGLVQSGSVRGQVDMVASSSGLVQSGSVRGQADMVASSTSRVNDHEQV